MKEFKKKQIENFIALKIAEIVIAIFGIAISYKVGYFLNTMFFKEETLTAYDHIMIFIVGLITIIISTVLIAAWLDTNWEWARKLTKKGMEKEKKKK